MVCGEESIVLHCAPHQKTSWHGLLDQTPADQGLHRCGAGACAADVCVYLGVVVVCGAVLLLDVLSTGSEEG